MKPIDREGFHPASEANLNLPPLLPIRSALFSNGGILNSLRGTRRRRVAVHVTQKSFKSIPRIPSLIIAGVRSVRKNVSKGRRNGTRWTDGRGRRRRRTRQRARAPRTMSFVSFRMADIMDCLTPLHGKYRLLRPSGRPSVRVRAQRSRSPRLDFISHAESSLSRPRMG